MTDRLLREADVLALVERRMETMQRLQEVSADDPPFRRAYSHCHGEMNMLLADIKALPPAPAGDVQRLREALRDAPHPDKYADEILFWKDYWRWLADSDFARTATQVNAPKPKRLGFPLTGGQHSGPSEESDERS